MIGSCWGAQAASLSISAPCRDAPCKPRITFECMFPASCRELPAGSLCSQTRKFRFSKFVAICVICGRFGDEGQIEKQSRYTQFEARPESCSQCCAHNIEKLHRGIRDAHSADKVGEIHFCDFSAADVWRSYPDIFHCFCARDYDATALGRRRILVLFTRRGPLANCVFRSSAPARDLRFWT